MEFLRASRRKNLMSDLAHIVLNIALVVVLFLLVNVSGQIEIALLLVLLSKWRVLAVRLRYWYANIIANLVDFIVGFSAVGLLYLAGTAAEGVSFWLQVAIAVLYAAWLIVIKPRSKPRAMYLQATIALFVGVWVVAAFAHTVTLPVAVLLYYIIGYGVAHHTLSVYKEQQPSLMAMVFGLVLAEFGWVTYHWTAGYGLVQMGDFKVPQMAIVAVLAALLVERWYVASQKGVSVRQVEYLAPIVFSVAAIVALLAFFSAVGAGIV